MRLKANLSKLVILGFIVFLWINEAGCQRNISPQAQCAIDFFENKQFDIAQTEFQKLIERFPQDPLYQYYYGATLTELNIQPSKAIEYLKTATAKNSNINSWHYLALEYYRQFKFEEAKTTLIELKKRAKWNENKKFETSKELERLNYAPKFFSKASQPEIISKNQIRNDSILGYFIKNLHIKTFKIGKLDKFDEPITILTDSAIIPNRYYYFSAKTDLNFRGKDIFRIKMKADSTWSSPESLGQKINSAEDDDYPLFNYHTNILYFASKGHRSAGGLDIYKSQLNVSKNEWSEAEQLSFPLNSQWNEYLYFENSNFAYFVSDRSCPFGYSTFYTLKKNTNDELFQVENGEKAAELAGLKVNSFETMKNITKEMTNEKQENVLAEQPSTLQEFVGMALQLQSRVDSLLYLSQKDKTLLNTNTEKDKRAVLHSEIAKYEKSAALIQPQLNDLYKNILDIENKVPANIVAHQESSKEHDNIFSLHGKPSYSNDNPFPESIELPDGVVYRIQLGVFSKPLSFEHFGGIQPISVENIQENKIIKYFAGIFKRFNDADNSLTKVKELGFKEAFIIAYYDKKKIPLERAKDIEKSR